MKKILLTAAAIVLLGFGCESKEPEPKTAAQLETERFVEHPNDIMLKNQKPGQTVAVAETKFAKPGFLAVIEPAQGEDDEESIVGYSPIIQSGQKQNRKIALTVLMEEGETYIVRMYDDSDGDTEFKLSKDNPIYLAGTTDLLEKSFTVVAE
ncbi:MAG: hypothetical protein CMI52_03225 [Parcubacteria group bacterium]|nr:hypothetical protein [Parcubacteria group bacterium]|tara:strand:- start:1955 stop:2410 length:456 start_codon:yes stop_codon:yes gene_type:complete